MILSDRVTIIIPTYNRAHLVGAAIWSALNQDYAHLDVVVVDDGSTDATQDVLAGFTGNPRVRLVTRSENGGVTAAKNTGLDSLEPGVRYFGILDSDDVLEPGAIRNLLTRFEASPFPLSQVFGWCVDSATGVATGTMSRRDGDVTYEDALCGRFHGEFWQLVSTEYLGVLRFDDRAGGNEAMIWWPMLKRAPGSLIGTAVRQYDRTGEDRVSNLTYTKTAALKLMWGYKALLSRVGDDMRALCPSNFASYSLELAKWALLAGDRSTFRTALAAAWNAKPSTRATRVGILGLMPSRLALIAYSRAQAGLKRFR